MEVKYPEFRVFAICLTSQSPPKKHNQKKKPTNPCAPCEFLKKCLPCLIIIKSCYFDFRINKPFTCSCYVICVSCSFYLIWTYYVRKGVWAFFNLITWAGRHRVLKWASFVFRIIIFIIFGVDFRSYADWFAA